MARAKDILTQALSLSRAQRAKLAHELLLSLDDDEQEELSPKKWEEAWAVEIERRLQEVESGTAKLLPWATVRRQFVGKRPATKKKR